MGSWRVCGETWRIIWVALGSVAGSPWSLLESWGQLLHAFVEPMNCYEILWFPLVFNDGRKLWECLRDRNPIFVRKSGIDRFAHEVHNTVYNNDRVLAFIIIIISILILYFCYNKNIVI